MEKMSGMSIVSQGQKYGELSENRTQQQRAASLASKLFNAFS